jgi:hypothetical protein
MLHLKAQKSEICQELPHPENTASPRSHKVDRKREHMFIRSISNKTPEIPKKRILGITALEQSMAEQFKSGSRIYLP